MQSQNKKDLPWLMPMVKQKVVLLIKTQLFFSRIETT